jgi:hypothetical protein
MQTLDARFKVVKGVLNQSATQTDTGTSATEKEVVGSRINLHPGEAGDGQTFKWTLGGAIGAGGNAAAVIKLYANGTAICTQTMAQSDAKDWFCTIICVTVNKAVQKSIGFICQQGEESAANYEAGAVDLSAGGALYLKIGSGHSSDSIQAEVCIVEKWDFAPMAIA